MNENGNADFAPKKKKKLLIILLVLGILIVSIPIGLRITANWLAQQKLNQFITGAGLQNEVSWSKVTYNLLTRQLDILNFRMEIAPDSVITADKISIPVYQRSGTFPQQITLVITDINIPVTEPIFRRYAAPLLRMNYADFEGSMTLHFGISDNILEMTMTNASFVDFGTVNAKLQLSNIQETTLKKLLSEIKDKPVRQAWASLLDGGFTNRVLHLFAEDTNTTFDLAKTRILNGLNQRMQTQYKTDSEARRSLAQIYRYIDNPHEISIQMITTEGLHVSDLIPPPESKGWRQMTAWFSGLPHKVVAN